MNVVLRATHDFPSHTVCVEHVSFECARVQVALEEAHLRELIAFAALLQSSYSCARTASQREQADALSRALSHGRFHRYLLRTCQEADE